MTSVACRIGRTLAALAATLVLTTAGIGYLTHINVDYPTQGEQK